MTSSVGEKRGVLLKAPRFFLVLDLIPPPAGAIGAPGLRLSGDVRGAGTLPRTMGRTPSPGS
ncbi:MAG TPA: hypothetical protein VMY40_03165, partial [Anaerolineae bacterium]|nr:hypothetical protein [Anaerolineae bacterium]